MDYVKMLRSKVGKEKVMLASSIVVVVNEKSEILLQKRGDDGNWGLPGGLIELDETPLEAGIREVYEETGMTLSNLKPLGYTVNLNRVWPNGDAAHVFVFGFYGQATNEKLVIDGDETIDLKYFKIDQLPVIPIHDNVEIIENYKALFNLN
jgi:8-oxo-dGTP pyrophosphatase MutT (NUDIX family)